MHNLYHFYFNKYILSPFTCRKYYLTYNFQYKALWFRIPKVATSSIRKHFEENTESKNYIYSSQVGYLHLMYKSYFKFAFIRNPTQRLLSCWKDKVLLNNYFGFDLEEYRDMKKFEGFVNWVSGLNVDSIYCDEHLRSQNSMIDLNNIDFLGRFENFHKDFKQISDRINMPLSQIYHRNKTDATVSKIFPETEKKIAEIYLKDFLFFYPQELRRIEKNNV